jgi:hypothetical protein
MSYFQNGSTGATIGDYTLKSLLELIIEQTLDNMDKQLLFESYQQEIQNLETQLASACDSLGPRSGVYTIEMSIQETTFIKQPYLLYIRKYGIPEDGIFLPSRLSEFTGTEH